MMPPSLPLFSVRSVSRLFSVFFPRRSFHSAVLPLSPLSIGSQAAAASAAANSSHVSSTASSSPSSISADSRSSSSLYGLPPLITLPRDRIYLKGLTFHAYHGFHPPERILGQKFIFDLTLFTSLKSAGQTGDLNDSIDYSQVYKSVERLVTESAPFLLLEQLGEAVARDLFHQYRNPSLAAIQICIKKPHVAVSGVLEYFAIDIFRTRQEYETQTTPQVQTQTQTATQSQTQTNNNSSNSSSSSS